MTDRQTRDVALAIHNDMLPEYGGNFGDDELRDRYMKTAQAAIAASDAYLKERLNSEETRKKLATGLAGAMPFERDDMEVAEFYAGAALDLVVEMLGGELPETSDAKYVPMLAKALRNVLGAYCNTMSSEYDFPNDPWESRPDKIRDDTRQIINQLPEEYRK